MSDQTLAALDDAIRAHLADDQDSIAVAWVLAVGTTGNPEVDFVWECPDGQPGYVSAGLATLAAQQTSRLDDSEDDE
jgi:predicted pyridoxine 5'-phosphate oxidase superfamily flavin-nucleotide-binding protein